jgi:pimeloyl-ACP methyl ester carboxylesterase
LSADDAWTEWGGSGEVLHFAHGNGFPPRTYRRLLEPLARDLRVVTLAARPLWPEADHRELHGWGQMADDLGYELWARGLEGSIGVGHSFGGVITLLAAARDPGLFSRVIVVDPVLLTGTHAAVWGFMRRLGLGRRLPIVRGALRRRRWWPDRDAARQAWSGRGIFAAWRPEVLEDYLECGLVAGGEGEGLQLAYPRRWEARIFRTTPHDPWAALRGVTIPVLALRGGRSEVFTAAAAARLGRTVPSCRVETVPGAGHCLPMERPDEVAARIRAFAREGS